MTGLVGCGSCIVVMVVVVHGRGRMGMGRACPSTLVGTRVVVVEVSQHHVVLHGGRSRVGVAVVPGGRCGSQGVWVSVGRVAGSVSGLEDHNSNRQTLGCDSISLDTLKIISKF